MALITNSTPSVSLIKNLVIFSSVNGNLFSPFAKSSLNKGITLPLEPRTFPYLTIENLVFGLPDKLFAAIKSLSDVNFVAPYKLIGLEALSVESETIFFTFFNIF